MESICESEKTDFEGRDRLVTCSHFCSQETNQSKVKNDENENPFFLKKELLQLQLTWTIERASSCLGNVNSKLVNMSE